MGKMHNNPAIFIFSLLFGFILFSCKSSEYQTLKNFQEPESVEYDITEIPLLGPASEKNSELSGLAWFDDNLILLPQYPFNIGEDTLGVIFKISKARLSDFISGKDESEIEPEKITIIAEGLQRFNQSGQGYESIAFNGNDVYLTIEASENSKMNGYIVKGKINNEATHIILDKKSLKRIEPQADIYNLSDETIFIYNNNIYTLYEANGKNVNRYPFSHKFDSELNLLGKINFPNIEYRITDASTPDNQGKFWVINYLYSGDWNDLIPADDEEEDFNPGKMENLRSTERLLEFQIKDSIIVRTEKKQLKIKLLNNNIGRNWEGLVKFGNYGFLMVSDYYPKTILGYLKYSN